MTPTGDTRSPARAADTPNSWDLRSARRRLLAFNLGEPLGHNCTASVLDLDSSRVNSTIELPGRPRGRRMTPRLAGSTSTSASRPRSW